MEEISKEHMKNFFEDFFPSELLRNNWRNVPSFFLQEFYGVEEFYEQLLDEHLKGLLEEITGKFLREFFTELLEALPDEFEELFLISFWKHFQRIGLSQQLS